ncbi:fungal-specific transcription factor domain-containing protein [Stachybotrys elegans]|uniref:Fungal-specific transcription factor domain-containing protein n=1 Tax=Stachybotrys elegans TaxID=80388 RepID=A0A8K0WPT9_9HYPO|nr:fungal-specific transcription factor domain-containing protein [Stachybotrys elegans]
MSSSSSAVPNERADALRQRDSPSKANIKTKTRSRNGCSQCKAKRLKCDEAKPECLTCIKNNRKCPGYGRSFRWSTKHEKTLNTGKETVLPITVEPARIIQPAAPAPLPLLQTTRGYGHGGRSSEEAPSEQSSVPLVQTPEMTSGSGVLPEENVIPPAASHFDGWTIPQFDLIGDVSLVQEYWVAEPAGPVLDTFKESTEQALVPVAPSMESSASGSESGRDPSPTLSYQQPLLPSVPRGLCDYSVVLVEEWFKHVCPIWSGFDSQANLNRILAQESWTRSAAVMHCLQSMAAICLGSQIPRMKRVARLHLEAAAGAIQTELGALRRSPQGELPADLLLALCCVGTAACWLDTKEIGEHYLKEAKGLLKRLNQDTSKLSALDLQRLSFFNNSLVYWNMLVAVVSDDQDDLGIPKPKKPSGLDLTGPITPHPWTGISVSAQLLFMQAIKLCRRFRVRHKQGMTFTMLNLQSALEEIEEAQKVEEELLGLDQHEVEEISETGDKMSPKAHFIYVAEAYRLASLLQLYQTFPDLVARRLPEDARDASGYVPWDKWIVPLCLRLVSILKKIPVSSRTRCIQPLLYITASTGLRFDIDSLDPMRDSRDTSAVVDLDVIQRSHRLRSEDLDADSSLAGLTKLSIEITHARRFILGRLSMLEHSLPPAPILVAKDLVKAIWAAYDLDTSRPSYTHWIDVMEELDLRTIFG